MSRHTSLLTGKNIRVLLILYCFNTITDWSDMYAYICRVVPDDVSADADCGSRDNCTSSDAGGACTELTGRFSFVCSCQAGYTGTGIGDNGCTCKSRSVVIQYVA